MTSPLFPPLQKGAEDPHNHLIPPHSSPNRSKKGLSFCSLEMEAAAVLCCFSLLFPEREREGGDYGASLYDVTYFLNF